MPRLLAFRLRPLPAARPAAAAPPRRVRSRRIVAWGLGAFAAAQLGLGFAAEAYPRIRDPLYGDKFAKLRPKLDRAAAANTKPATVVMIGSSRTGLAFHGQRAEAALAPAAGRPVTAFNFGVPASGPVTHLVYLNRLLKAGVVPDLLLVEILPSMLADDPAGPLERLWFYADRVTFTEQQLLIRHGFPAAAVRERYAKSVLVPGYTLRFQVMCRVAPSWLPWQVRFDWSRGADACGWGTTVTQDITADTRAGGVGRARAEYAPILAGMTPGGGAASALRELLATCKARGIPTRLVLMPEGTAFRSWYGPGVRGRLDAFLAGVARDHGTAVVDARDWLPDDAFYDAHHMLRAGAEAFTDRLARDVIAPALPPAAGVTSR